MDSSATFSSGDEWSSQDHLFSKLGNYFDRLEWWEEGAETLKAFFDDDTPYKDTTDKRLEDLLDLLESLQVFEEPSPPDNAGVNLSDLTGFSQELKHDLSHDGAHSIDLSSNDIQLQAEPDNLSKDLFSAATAVHVEFARNRVASAITNDAQNSRSPSEVPPLAKQSPVLDTDDSSNAIDKSSPLFTSTTTSTRQTSPLPDSTTRASSILADAAISSRLSPEKEAIPPHPAPKLDSSVRNVTADHRQDLPPGITRENEDDTLADLGSGAGNDIASTPFDHMHKGAFNEHSATTAKITTVSENDPTGLQAIKDEISNEHELPKDVDSSIITQEDENSVVHDPSAAATSFFPPNPYSDDPYDSNFYVTQVPSTASNEDHEPIEDSSADPTLTSLASGDGQTSFNTVQFQPTIQKEEPNDQNHENIDNPSADSTLTSLALGDKQLPESRPVNQVDNREGYTPSPPPISPLTPPLNFADNTYANADVTEKVGPENGDDTALLANASIMDRPITILNDATIDQDTVDHKLQEVKSLESVNEVIDELADNDGVDGPKTSSDPLALANAKRKQEQPHADEPAPKRRLSPITEDEHPPGTNTEPPHPSRKRTIKGRSNKSAQKGKNKATLKPANCDSPDELAPTSPDELADSPLSNPFNLNRGSQKLGKTNLPPLRRLIGDQRATRGGVGRKELAGLLAASPPRKAAEKEKSDVGGRLRSQSRTPVPASASDTVPDIQTTVAAKAIETNETSPPAQPKRNRLPGAHPLSALELRELGDTPILESRTRTRTITIEPTPEPATRDTAKSASKRTKSAISNAEVERLGAVEITESRTRNSTAEPTPVPEPAPAPAKRAKKPVAKAVAQPGGKPSPFALTLKSKGTSSASRRRAPPKKKAVEPKKKKEAAVGKQTKTPAKRKPKEDGEKVENGATATRASKRVAGVELEGE